MASSLPSRQQLAPFPDLRTTIDRLFGDFASDQSGAVWSPSIDVIRNDDELIVKADVPGFKPEEIDVEIDDGALVLAGRHDEQQENREGNMLRRERRFGAFSRVIPLPSDADKDTVEATIHDGVLEVRTPLTSVSDSKRRVEVKSGDDS
jgi:HSP20 family protein